MMNKEKNGFDVSDSEEVELIVHEIALMKALIKERKHPLDLLRELISNSAAREVSSQNISIKYYVHPDYGNVFEVKDDGCGMDFTNDVKNPGRLDKFFGLGLSLVVGLEGDEFAWKGLGSKLSFQSKRVEIETWTGEGKVLKAEINEPWDTIGRNLKPRPKITRWDPSNKDIKGTTIKVYGHPPHWKDKEFSFEQIRDYLYHRTFVGYTRERDNPPKIELAAFKRSEMLEIGFPELKKLPQETTGDTVIIDPISIQKNIPGTNQGIKIILKGLYTWNEKEYGLGDIHLNNGLIVSVKGIPYFSWNLRELGSGQLGVANPGNGKCCIIAECDQIQEDMNISRSDLVDSAISELFRSTVKETIQKLESESIYLAFRRYQREQTQSKIAKEISKHQKDLESEDQEWVYFREKETSEAIRLIREPQNETETLAILWKLEALGGLPFNNFETLAYFGRGPDLIVHFQEDERSAPERYTVFEIERLFWSYKSHGHTPPLHPTVICWDIGSNPKVRLEHTEKKYKYSVRLGDKSVRVYVLKNLEGIFTGNYKIPNIKMAGSQES